MNTTFTTCTSEHIWPSRRCSTETIFSIQGQETDVVRDTSDTDVDTDRLSNVSEYEPITESEEDAPVEEDTSALSDNDVISTKVIEIMVADNVDADSEKTDHSESDSELDLCDYWHCAQCRAKNNNPLYRYCQKCFKVRKNFFPPRPKAKRKRNNSIDPEIPRTLCQDSGVELNSQELNSQASAPDTGEGTSESSGTKCEIFNGPITRHSQLRFRYDSVDGTKRRRLNSDSFSEDEKASKVRSQVSPIVKTVSDPSISIDDSSDLKITKKAIADTLKENMDGKDLCVVCCSEPKSGVFVHGRIAHICCCYKCAVKVWAKAKRCPVCNCKVSNVLRAIVT